MKPLALILLALVLLRWLRRDTPEEEWPDFGTYDPWLVR